MVYLYKNKLPNYAENTHYFFNAVDDYVNSLGVEFLRFEEDRYTMNGNIAEVQLPTVTDLDDVTYIAWNNGGAWRFFFVRSAVYQSGFAIFTLDVDLWATHIARATLSNIRVTRCNRAVGVGVYDNIPVAVGREFSRLGDAMNENDLAILYVVAYATEVSTIVENNAATALGVFANEIGNITSEDVPKIDRAIEDVAGIYAAKANIGTVEANVLKAYIVPKSVLGIKSEITPIFNTKTPNFSGTFTPSFEVAPLIFPKVFDIDIDPNKKYFVGTKHAGVELARVTGRTQVFYNFIVFFNNLNYL